MDLEIEEAVGPGIEVEDEGEENEGEGKRELTAGEEE